MPPETKDHAQANPQQRGEPANLLSGEDRPGEGPHSDDGAEVLSEQLERTGRHEIDAVVRLVRRRLLGIVERVLS